MKGKVMRRTRDGQKVQTSFLLVCDNPILEQVGTVSGSARAKSILLLFVDSS